MHIKIFATILGIAGLNVLCAQPGLSPDAKVLVAMEKVRALAGEWHGSGWIQMGPQRHQFDQKESVTVKANGAVVVIDGLGRNIADSTQIIHQAYAVVSYDLKTKKYLMRAFRGDGNYVDADFSVQEDGSIVWGFTHPMAGQIRYTIRLQNGQWVETGDTSRDGQTWLPFFEMKLTQ